MVTGHCLVGPRLVVGIPELTYSKSWSFTPHIQSRTLKSISQTGTYETIKYYGAQHLGLTLPTYMGHLPFTTPDVIIGYNKIHYNIHNS